MDLTECAVGVVSGSGVGNKHSTTASEVEVEGLEITCVPVSKQRSSLASIAVTMFWSSRSSLRVSSSSSSSFPIAEKRIVMVSRDTERWTSTLGAVGLAEGWRFFSPWLPSRLVIALLQEFQDRLRVSCPRSVSRCLRSLPWAA